MSWSRWDIPLALQLLNQNLDNPAACCVKLALVLVFARTRSGLLLIAFLKIITAWLNQFLITFKSRAKWASSKSGMMKWTASSKNLSRLKPGSTVLIALIAWTVSLSEVDLVFSLRLRQALSTTLSLSSKLLEKPWTVFPSAVSFKPDHNFWYLLLEWTWTPVVSVSGNTPA